MRFKSILLSTITIVCCLLLSACGSNRGGYYKNDGPPSGGSLLANSFKNTPNAKPKYEPPHKFANRPYKVKGKRYSPITGDQPMVQTGQASWYGKMFHGKKTSTGEIYNMYSMSAAHKTMELPSYAKVTNLENGRSVIVRVNDRGPFVDNRVIDLSYAAASKLGYVNKGTARVKVERIRMADIRAGRVPSSFSKVSLADNSSSQADALAIATIIGAAANATNSNSIAPTKQPTPTIQEPLRPIEATQQPAIQDNSSQITPPSHSNVPEDLQGAVNLTEVAQHEMVSTEVALPSSPVVTKGSWCLQAGAFGSEVNAQNFAQNLKNEIGENIVVRQEGNLYKVLFGNFLTKDEATVKALQVEQSYGKKFVPMMVP